jgi:hypothetical protein
MMVEYDVPQAPDTAALEPRRHQPLGDRIEGMEAQHF